MSVLSPDYTHETWLNFGSDQAFDLDKLRKSMDTENTSENTFNLVINAAGQTFSVLKKSERRSTQRSCPKSERRSTQRSFLGRDRRSSQRSRTKVALKLALKKKSRAQLSAHKKIALKTALIENLCCDIFLLAKKLVVSILLKKEFYERKFYQNTTLHFSMN